MSSNAMPEWQSFFDVGKNLALAIPEWEPFFEEVKSPRLESILIVDKDGTLVRTKSGKPFVNEPEDQELIEGVFEKLSQVINGGADVFVASNQGGVPQYKTLDYAIAEMRYCMELLPMISGCFFSPGDGSTAYYVDSQKNLSVNLYDSCSFEFGGYRKPDPGMIRLIQWIYKPQSISFVGDRPEDEQSAIAAGVPFQWAHDWLGGTSAIAGKSTGMASGL